MPQTDRKHPSCWEQAGRTSHRSKHTSACSQSITSLWAKVHVVLVCLHVAEPVHLNSSSSDRDVIKEKADSIAGLFLSMTSYSESSW